MRAHGLLLRSHSGRSDECRHDGRVAVDRANPRWCPDGFEIGCDGGKARVALDCCDREGLGFVATTGPKSNLILSGHQGQRQVLAQIPLPVGSAHPMRGNPPVAAGS